MLSLDFNATMVFGFASILIIGAFAYLVILTEKQKKARQKGRLTWKKE